MGNLPHKNYPHLMVLRPAENRSTRPKPQVFTGAAWAIGIELAIAFAATLTAALWGMK